METLQKMLSHSLTAQGWKKVGIVPHYGIAVPLSTLHTARSCGIGEFMDLLPLIDWCNEVKMDVLQLLPLNDTGLDPSPYNAQSSCALNPIFLSLHELPFLQDDAELQKKIKEAQKLTASNRVLYGEVRSHKMSFLQSYFEKYGSKILEINSFGEFLDTNPWLEPYALFRTLKNKLGQQHFLTWPKELKMPTKEEYDELVDQHVKDITFYIIVQYLCFLQLKTVKEYADSKGVFLKGDIPILISPDSADVWHNPEFFNTDYAAGGPPDVYNTEGQYWGFPLFNWQAIKKSHYSWWKQRLQYASEFFSIYRIDHVIGLFRIWAIPLNHDPKEGHFIPIDESLWGPQGKAILEALISFTSMLPIAEDLGPVPDVVRPILLEMGICSTKVMRWERLWKEDSRFIPIQYYPPVSMTSLSTHDSPTLSLWWRDFPEEAKVYADSKHWPYAPALTEQQHKEILWDSNHTSSLFHINLLQEYLALFPDLVWPTLEDERINIPGKVLPTNWTYRFRLPLEKMLSHEDLKQAMAKILFSPDPLSL